MAIFDRPTAVVAQILAAKDLMSKAGTKAVADAYHLAQKTAMFAGRTRTYTPLRDTEDTQPPTSEVVQVSVWDIIKQARDGMHDQIEWNLLRDYANMHEASRADVAVGTEVLVVGAPAPALLSLEQRLNEWIAFLEKLPTLEPNQEWTFYKDEGLYKSAITKTLRTKKVPKVISKAKATDKHPEQAEIYMDDITVGTYEDRLIAKKVSPTQQRTLIAQAQRLLAAVRDAQQIANAAKVPVEKRAEPLIKYLLAPLSGNEEFPVNLG